MIAVNIRLELRLGATVKRLILLKLSLLPCCFITSLHPFFSTLSPSRMFRLFLSLDLDISLHYFIKDYRILLY